MRRKGLRSGQTIKKWVVAARWIVPKSTLPPRGLPSCPRPAARATIHAAWLAAVFLFPSGCSSLRGKNESIVRVKSKRDTALAIRLTHAGIRSLNKHHIDLAAKHFRQAVQADHSYGPAHNNLGLMHYEQGNLYQAVMAFEQAREFLPDDPSVVYNLALALESAGRTAEAMDLYYTANAMDRANPNYLGNLVRLRVRIGERDEILQQQLRDLVLIETRPDWRRWADTQLALTMNDALDRGPATPDLQSSLNETADPNRTDLRDKIIDLTPAMPASFEQPVPTDGSFDDLPDEPDSDPFETDQIETPPSTLEDGFMEDLSPQDYYRE